LKCLRREPEPERTRSRPVSRSSSGRSRPSTRRCSGARQVRGAVAAQDGGVDLAAAGCLGIKRHQGDGDVSPGVPVGTPAPRRTCGGHEDADPGSSEAQPRVDLTISIRPGRITRKIIVTNRISFRNELLQG
jgi:hypothetical protein